MDDSIIHYIRRAYNLLIGERTAETIKSEIGYAHIDGKEELNMEIRGRDLVSGLPKTVTVSSTEIHQALVEPIQAIVDAVKVTLEHTPPELAADIMDRGIMMAGGGSLLNGLDELLMRETGMPVHIAERPLTAVVEGTGRPSAILTCCSELCWDQDATRYSRAKDGVVKNSAGSPAALENSIDHCLSSHIGRYHP